MSHTVCPSRFRDSCTWLLLISLSPWCLQACTAPAGQAQGDPFDLDQVSATRAELTTRVKTALVAERGIAAASIQVVLGSADGAAAGTESESDADSSGDSGARSRQVLRLEGFVDDEKERNAALSIARQASQGLEVVDALEVR